VSGATGVAWECAALDPSPHLDLAPLTLRHHSPRIPPRVPAPSPVPTHSLKFFLSLYGHKLPAISLDISSDSTLLLSGSADKNIKVCVGRRKRVWRGAACECVACCCPAMN
jgi:hypothetical protein